MALLKALTQDKVSGTGTLTVESMIFGGVAISTDNSTVGTVQIRRDNAQGKVLQAVATATTMWIGAPVTMEGTDQLYFSVTGANCEIFLYEWVN